MEQLARDADLIVVGTVEAVRSELWHGKIFSYATIAVNSTIKGELGQNEVVVRFPGGKVGDIGMKVENIPDYKEGESIIAFLRRISNTPYFTTVGGFQGKFLIEDNMVVRENLSLDQFTARIENILGPAK